MNQNDVDFLVMGQRNRVENHSSSHQSHLRPHPIILGRPQVASHHQKKILKATTISSTMCYIRNINTNHNINIPKLFADTAKAIICPNASTPVCLFFLICIHWWTWIFLFQLIQCTTRAAKSFVQYWRNVTAPIAFAWSIRRLDMMTIPMTITICVTTPMIMNLVQSMAFIHDQILIVWITTTIFRLKLCVDTKDDYRSTVCTCVFVCCLR